MKHSYQTGQTLIEVIAALTAAVVIIAAITSASLNALNNSQFSRDQNIASQYSQAGLEIIRNMRNQSIASLSATYLPTDTYCFANSCTALINTDSQCWRLSPGTKCPQNIGKFVREAYVDHSASDCNVSPTPIGAPSYYTENVKITVVTYWSDSRCSDPSNLFCHSAAESTCFSDFTILPTP